jgi:hypothetical protein
MQETGRILLTCADRNHGWLRLVQPNENAGMFTVRLVEGGYVDAVDLAQWQVCPGSPQAKLIRANPRQFFVHIPSREEFEAMTPQQQARVKAWMSPSYAYPLGYLVGQQYYYPRIQGYRTPILCDAPGVEGHGMSPNHGYVMQVLFSDGSVGVQTSAKVNNGDDDLFSNSQGQVAPGMGSDDVVLGSSAATANIFFLGSNRPQNLFLDPPQFPQIKMIGRDANR